MYEIRSVNIMFTFLCRLPKYFIVPAAVTDEDFNNFPGNGLPVSVMTSSLLFSDQPVRAPVTLGIEVLAL